MTDIYEPCIMLKPSRIDLHETTRIDSFTKIEGGQGVRIGAHVHISSFCHVNVGGGEVVIGDYAAMASGSKILGGSNLETGESMSAAAPHEMQRVGRDITVIGAGAFLGVNAVVMPGVRIGNQAIIGTGAVVTKDVPDNEVWVGIPAKFARMRKPIEEMAL